MKLTIIHVMLYSYYSSNFRNEKILSLTMDGYGDGCNASITSLIKMENLKILQI